MNDDYLSENKQTRDLVFNFLHKIETEHNLLEFTIHFVSSDAIDYTDKRLFINRLIKSIFNKNAFYFEIANNYREFRNEPLNRNPTILNEPENDYNRKIIKILKSFLYHAHKNDKSEIESLFNFWIPSLNLSVKNMY